MLERAAQLDELLAAVTAARAGRGCVVLVDGEAGIGKSSLVAAFLARLDWDVHVLVGGCDDLRTRRPLGPLRDAVRGTDGPLAEALRAGDPERVFAAVLAHLQRPPASVLVVEDVHWADDATLDVLRYAGRRIAGRCGVLVLTVRGGELALHHPLRALFGELAGARWVRPPPLSTDAVTELAGIRRGAPSCTR